MANQKMLVVLVMLMAACLPLNGAVNHLVGGERGWSMDVDYKAWAESQQFYVGDKLGMFSSLGLALVSQGDSTIVLASQTLT